jgi:hypothetical protein
LTSRYDEAFRYAHGLHREQTRKGTNIPYISHLMTVSAIVGITFKRTDKPLNEAPTLGWSELVLCSDLMSLDGIQQMTLSENHVVRFRDERGSKFSKTGLWSYDELSKRYSVTLLDQTSIYSIVAPRGTDTCMLIKGDLEAADRGGSWFSSSANDYDDPREDDHGAR